MIYCGYQGVGKSTYCRNNPTTTMDLDSSLFTKEENWEVGYVEKANEISTSGKKVFISAHPIVIETLISKGYQFTVLIPSMDKMVWKSRLEFRYLKNPSRPNLNALNDFVLNYDRDMSYYHSLESRGVIVKEVVARVETNLDQVL